MVDDDVVPVGLHNPLVPGKVLYVIDIQSGDIIQRVHIDLLGGEVSATLVDADEIYIASFGASKVVVLRYAGSEA